MLTMNTRNLIHIWIFVFFKVYVLGLRNCELNFDRSICSNTEYCDEDSKQCQCLKGHQRINSTSCIRINKTEGHTPEHSSLVENDGGSVTPYILTPLIIIVIVICGIYINRKYHLITWAKNKLHQTNRNYDEFMIGQDLDDDDPPLN